MNRPIDLWESIQAEEYKSPIDIRDLSSVNSATPTDVAAHGSVGTDGVAKKDHTHRGISNVTVGSVVVHGPVTLVEGTNIDLTATEGSGDITIATDDDLTLTSISADTIVADDVSVTDQLIVDHIQPQGNSPSGVVQVDGGLTVNGVVRADVIRPASDSPSEDLYLDGNISITGALRVDEIGGYSMESPGDVQFTSNILLADGVLINLEGLSGNVITTDSVEHSLEELDSSQYYETNTGFVAWSSGTDASTYTITGGKFQLDRAGYGFINGKRINWVASQVTSALTANACTFVYIDSSGNIQTTATWSTDLFHDNIVLFEVLYDGTNYVVVKENHPYEFPSKVSTDLHELIKTRLCGSGNSAPGADIGRVATGTGAAAGDRQLKITGAAIIQDHGLETAIADSGGAAITINWYYTDGSGHWTRNAQQTGAPMLYNAAGTPTAIGSGKFGAYRIYVSKDDIESSLPTYYAVMSNAQYTSLATARAAIVAGIPEATNELVTLEICQLGYIIVTNNVSGGYIAEVQVQKTTLTGTTTGAGATNLAALISVVTTDFSGAPTEVLSSSDSSVQNALETINDMLTTAHTTGGNWIFGGNLDALAGVDVTGSITATGALYVDHILPYSSSPTVDIELDHNVSISGDLTLGGDIKGQYVDIYGTTSVRLYANGSLTITATEDTLYLLEDTTLSGVLTIDTGGSIVSPDIFVTDTIYADKINPYSSSPVTDITLGHNVVVSGDLVVDGKISVGNDVYAQIYRTTEYNIAAANTWYDLELDTNVQISGVEHSTSLNTNQITVPAGTYMVSWMISCYATVTNQVFGTRLMYNVDTTPLEFISSYKQIVVGAYDIPLCGTHVFSTASSLVIGVQIAANNVPTAGNEVSYINDGSTADPSYASYATISIVRIG